MACRTGCSSYMTYDVDGAVLAGGILAGANRTFLRPPGWPRCSTPARRVKLFGALKTQRLRCVAHAVAVVAAGRCRLADTEFIQVYGPTEVRRGHPVDAPTITAAVTRCVWSARAP